MLNVDPGMYMYCAARVRFIRELNYFRAGHFETTNYEKLYSLHNSERCLTHIRGQIGIEFYVGVYNIIMLVNLALLIVSPYRKYMDSTIERGYDFGAQSLVSGVVATANTLVSATL